MYSVIKCNCEFCLSSDEEERRLDAYYEEQERFVEQETLERKRRRVINLTHLSAPPVKKQKQSQ